MDSVPVPACFEKCGVCSKEVKDDTSHQTIFSIHDGQVQISQALLVFRNPLSQPRSQDTSSSSQELQRAVVCTRCHLLVTAFYNLRAHFITRCAPDSPVKRYIDAVESKKFGQADHAKEEGKESSSSSQYQENIEGKASQPGASNSSQEDGEEGCEEKFRGMDSRAVQAHSATANGIGTIGTVRGAGGKKRVHEVEAMTPQEPSAAEARKRGPGRPRKIPKIEELPTQPQNPVVLTENFEEELNLTMTFYRN